jgi:hypothetical protein
MLGLVEMLWGSFESTCRVEFRSDAPTRRVTLIATSVTTSCPTLPPGVPVRVEGLGFLFSPPTHFLFECLSIDYKVVIF